jgi:hypothetical protein
MTTEQEPKNNIPDLSKTHTLYVPPDGDFIPLIITRPKHPLVASSEKEPIFCIKLHLDIARNFARHMLEESIKKAEGRNQDHLSWYFTGDIYLPKT